MTVNRKNVITSSVTVNVPVDIFSQLPFPTWRLLILHLADGRCEFCPSTDNLHCHHIDQNRDNNCLVNGLCLCAKCHHEWHIAASTHTNMLIEIMKENRINQLKEISADNSVRRR